MLEYATARKEDPTTPARPAGVRDLCRKGMLLLALAVLCGPVLAHGQDTRKIKSRVPPEYPMVARRLHVRGIARVQATITRDGTVKEVRDLGGNPILLEALTAAVKQWRYEPADRTSVIEVKFEFTP